MSTLTFDRISTDPAFQELFLTGHRRQLMKNQVVIEEGDSPTTLYLLMSGSVSVQLQNWHGRDALLAYMHAGHFFGEMGLFAPDARRCARVECVTDCLLLEIGYARFLELTRKHVSLWLELASQLATRLRAANRRLAEMPVLDPSDRIWSVLTELAEHSTRHCSEGIELRITRENLGKLAGCSRELAGSVLKTLCNEGRVLLRGQQIIVRSQQLMHSASRAAG
ncbi:MAG: cyclic nucleotide-binding domain-containing protein [Pseudomonadota bacterium]